MSRLLSPRRRQGGAIGILVLTALLMATCLMCLLIDLSRVAARKAELQVAVDAAALTAAQYLKTTPNAYAGAVTAAGQVKNYYNYRSSPGSPQVKLQDVTIRFGATYDTTDWKYSSTTVPGLKYVRIDSATSADEAYGKVELMLMHIPYRLSNLTNAPTETTVSASAVAGPINTVIGLRQ